MPASAPGRSSALDIYAIRRRSRRTQEQFADALGVPPSTLRSWEQRRKRPSGAARALLRLIEQRPELLERLTADINREMEIVTE
jgi:putative transcriptional regulator